MFFKLAATAAGFAGVANTARAKAAFAAACAAVGASMRSSNRVISVSSTSVFGRPAPPGIQSDAAGAPSPGVPPPPRPPPPRPPPPPGPAAGAFGAGWPIATGIPTKRIMAAGTRTRLDMFVFIGNDSRLTAFDPIRAGARIVESELFRCNGLITDRPEGLPQVHPERRLVRHQHLVHHHHRRREHLRGPGCR